MIYGGTHLVVTINVARQIITDDVPIVGTTVNGRA